MPGHPLLHDPSMFKLPVFILPDCRGFTEIVSIVNRAVFDGVNARKAVALFAVAMWTVYVPFADIASPDTPQIDGVTVPTVRAEMVKTRRYSR